MSDRQGGGSGITNRVTRTPGLTCPDPTWHLVRPGWPIRTLTGHRSRSGPKPCFWQKRSKTSKTVKTRFGNHPRPVTHQGQKTAFFDIPVCQIRTRTLPGWVPPLRPIPFLYLSGHRLFPTFLASPRPTFWRQKRPSGRCNPVVVTGAFQWKKRRNSSGRLGVIFSGKKQGSAQAYSDGV